MQVSTGYRCAWWGGAPIRLRKAHFNTRAEGGRSVQTAVAPPKQTLKGERLTFSTLCLLSARWRHFVICGPWTDPSTQIRAPGKHRMTMHHCLRAFVSLISTAHCHIREVCCVFDEEVIMMQWKRGIWILPCSSVSLGLSL